MSTGEKAKGYRPFLFLFFFFICSCCCGRFESPGCIPLLHDAGPYVNACSERNELFHLEIKESGGPTFCVDEASLAIVGGH